jgi:hypothetical protein
VIKLKFTTFPNDCKYVFNTIKLKKLNEAREVFFEYSLLRIIGSTNKKLDFTSFINGFDGLFVRKLGKLIIELLAENSSLYKNSLFVKISTRLAAL